MEIINHNFKRLRKQKGLTQHQFAEILHTNRQNIGAYEEGRAMVPVPVIKTLLDICLIKKNELFEFMFDKNFLIGDKYFLSPKVTP